MKRLMPSIAAAAMTVAFSAQAEQGAPGDTALAFGNKLSVASVAAALQAAGYQALPSRPPQLPDSMLGIISTGINGAKATVLVTKCEGSKTDDACAVSFMVSFNDDKHLLTDTLLETINEKTVFVKAIRGIRPADHAPMLSVSYNFMVKDIDDTRFVAPLMQNFAQDVGRVAAIYAAAAQQAQPPAPAPAQPK